MNSSNIHVAFWIAAYLFVFVPISGQVQAQSQPTQTQIQSTQSPVQSSSVPPPVDLQKLQSDWQKLQSELSAQKEAQETLKKYVELAAAIITIVTAVGILLQILIFIADARSRRRIEQEGQKQSAREDTLNTRYLAVLDVASQAAKDAQNKVANLEEGGIRRAGETLVLINNLLQITERAAAKAAGAQFDFLSRSIGVFDTQCQSLIAEATKSDDRDIIAKPEFRERVRVLTKQIESLDNQIITYNESVPLQFGAVTEGDQPNENVGLSKIWTRLSLTGPCLFIRGMNQHLDQNFAAAISDWKSSLAAKNANAVQVDANYWIGYVNNTLGNFDQAPSYLLAAATVAPEQRKIELRRLELETRLFDLDLAEVPAGILTEGEEYFGKMDHRANPRAISSFATTMGNICMIQHVRNAIAHKIKFALPDVSTEWFERAIRVQPRSRWARFGVCQNLFFSGQALDGKRRTEVEDVIGSVNREFQSRVEHRSKVLSKATEFICMVMLGSKDKERLSTIAGLIEHLTSDVIARTIYSQFRKQNVSKDIFLKEFAYLRETMDLAETFRWANTPSDIGKAQNA